MVKKFLLLLPAALLAIAGCTSVDVRQVDKSYDISHVCIEENSKVIVPDFVNTIEDGFNDHGITTELYSGVKPGHCEYRLTYTALRSWDLSTYLSHAELRLYKGGARIGYAEYHLVGKGGFALNKWASVKSKMTPVIDELLAQHDNGLHASPGGETTGQAAPATISENETIGKYSFAAGQFARSQNCIPKFKPQLIDVKPTSELYTVLCNNDATIVVKCTDGNCGRME